MSLMYEMLRQLELESIRRCALPGEGASGEVGIEPSSEEANPCVDVLLTFAPTCTAAHNNDGTNLW